MDKDKIRLLKGLSTGLVIAAMVFAFLIAGIRLFGVQVYGVLTGSMEPSYPTGSQIYVKDVDAADLRVNDVITFSISPGVIATHRIVEIVPDEQYPTILRYRTKGDANKDVDASLVSANNIIGKAMFAIPQLGYLASYIQQPPGIYVDILVCGLMIAFVFYADSLEEKQKQQSQQPFAEEKPKFDLAALVNKVSQKLLGKNLIKVKAPPEPAVRQGYAPQQPMQQPFYPQQYGGVQPMQYPQEYPQQGYPQQYYAPPPTGRRSGILRATRRGRRGGQRRYPQPMQQAPQQLYGQQTAPQYPPQQYRPQQAAPQYAHQQTAQYAPPQQGRQEV